MSTQKFKSYLNQDYEKIKSSLLSSGKLFEDDQFPANSRSLSRFNEPDSEIEWKRPKEFSEKPPKFIVDRIEPNDLDQGNIGDCWFISAAAVVANIQEYIDVVIPKDQSFDQNYAGIFRFRFWRFGEWIEVVIDDRLPVDNNNQLVYCHNSKDTNEMFAPLLEKAYAKLNECYEFLDGGDAVDAMIDMTGGIHERYSIKKRRDQASGEKTLNKNELWEVIFKSNMRKSLLGASINVPPNTAQEALNPNGLAYGHAYCILDVFELINIGGQYTEMRNPWGQDKSYTGKWSCKSSEWNQVSQEIKTALEFNDQTDGQFFISLDDFVINFDDLDMVHVDLNAFSHSKNECKWIYNSFPGAWKRGVNAGGCGNGRVEDYWTNPQFLVSLTLQNNQDKMVSIVVSLIQTEQNRKRSETNGQYESSLEPFNFNLYKVKPGIQSKKRYTYSDLDEVYSYHVYAAQREISAALEVSPGDYVIIPSLFEKDVEMKFILRVYAEGQLTNDLSLKTFDLNKKKKPKPAPVEDQNVNKPSQKNEKDEATNEDANNEDPGQENEENNYEDGNNEDPDQENEENNYVNDENENAEQDYPEEEYQEENQDEEHYNDENYENQEDNDTPDRRDENKIENKNENKRFGNWRDKRKPKNDDQGGHDEENDRRRNRNKNNDKRRKDKNNRRDREYEEYEEEYEDEYETYEVEEIPDEFKMNRRNYEVHIRQVDNMGQVISRACLIM